MPLLRKIENTPFIFCVIQIVATAILFISPISTINSSASTHEFNVNMNIGRPTFDCKETRWPEIRYMICGSDDAKSADWELAGAYWALNFSIAEADRVSFRDSHIGWINGIAAACGRAPTRQVASECVARAYRERAQSYLVTLRGDALAEAVLPPLVKVQIQEALIGRRLLDGDADGVIGASTRTAIIAFQSSLGEAETGFLTTSQRWRLDVFISQAEQNEYEGENDVRTVGEHDLHEVCRLERDEASAEFEKQLKGSYVRIQIKIDKIDAVNHVISGTNEIHSGAYVGTIALDVFAGKAEINGQLKVGDTAAVFGEIADSPLLQQNFSDFCIISVAALRLSHFNDINSFESNNNLDKSMQNPAPNVPDASSPTTNNEKNSSAFNSRQVPNACRPRGDFDNAVDIYEHYLIIRNQIQFCNTEYSGYGDALADVETVVQDLEAYLQQQGSKGLIKIQDARNKLKAAQPYAALANGADGTSRQCRTVVGLLSILKSALCQQ